jgi:NAD(P)-dependent dehydrogenase (short-subunit alcohol dehydrogenase family)
MKKRVTMITGAASGIGKGIAQKFATEGSDLILIDLQAKKLEELKNELLNTYSDLNIILLAGDITSESFVDDIMKKSLQAFPEINVLVNSAGIFPSTPFHQISRDEWNKVFNVNVSSVFFLTQQVSKWMIDSKSENANIVNITSAASEVARPGVAHYCSSKAAVKMLTQVLALELGPHQVRVNAVGPGLVETETLLKTLTTEKAKVEHQEKVSYSPLNRTAKVEEIADAVFFIASPQASFVTGQNLLVDGGYSAGRVFKSFE